MNLPIVDSLPAGADGNVPLPAPPPTTSALQPAPAASKSLLIINICMAAAIGISFFVLLSVLVVSFKSVFDVLQERGTDAAGKQVFLSTAEKMAIAASAQVAVGMMMGFVSVYIGLMMSWFGINAQFAMSGKVGDKGELSLTSASPGLLFFLGGIILIGFSLHKEIQFRDVGDIRRQAVAADTKSDGNRIKPNPPPPTDNSGAK